MPRMQALIMLCAVMLAAPAPVSAFSETEVQVGEPIFEPPITGEMMGLLGKQTRLLGGTHVTARGIMGWSPSSCPAKRERMRELAVEKAKLVARTTQEKLLLADAVGLMRMFEEYRLNARAIDALYERSCRPGA